MSNILILKFKKTDEVHINIDEYSRFISGHINEESHITRENTLRIYYEVVFVLKMKEKTALDTNYGKQVVSIATYRLNFNTLEEAQKALDEVKSKFN
jgi:hypothetical protein